MFSPHLSFGSCSFAITSQILKCLPNFLLDQEGEELCPLPLNCSILAGETQRGSVIRCVATGSILGLWWAGWSDNIPLEESRNSCSTQYGQPDFSLIVSLFWFYPICLTWNDTGWYFSVIVWFPFSLILMKLISKTNFKCKRKPVHAWDKKNEISCGNKKDLTMQSLINIHFGKQMAVLQLRLEMLLKNTLFATSERQFISHRSFLRQEQFSSELSLYPRSSTMLHAKQGKLHPMVFELQMGNPYCFGINSTGH